MGDINVVFITENNSPLSFCLSFLFAVEKKKREMISVQTAGVGCKVNAARQMTNELKMAASSVPWLQEEMNAYVLLLYSLPLL